MFFFFKQKTAYEMRISDWSSDVCSSDLRLLAHAVSIQPGIGLAVQGMMTGIDVPPLERQICVLAVLHLDRGAYEWAQHMEVSKAMGIAEEKVAAIDRKSVV